MTKKKDDALATVESNFAIISRPDGAEMMTQTLDALGVDTFGLGQIRIPRGGGRTWEIETATGLQSTTALEVVIGAWRGKLRKWYREPFGEGEAGPPDCSSGDGLSGYGINSEDAGAEPESHDCATCEWNQFGSARNGSKGKDCSEYMLIYALREGAVLPDVLQVPPTSLKAMKRYGVTLAGEMMSPWDVVTKLELTIENKGGFDTAIIAPTVSRVLGDEEKARMKPIAESLKDFVKAQPVAG